MTKEQLRARILELTELGSQMNTADLPELCRCMVLYLDLVIPQIKHYEFKGSPIPEMKALKRSK